MTDHVDDRKRQVVPRWRPARIAASLGVLDGAIPSRPAGFLAPAPGELEELERNWRRERSLAHAANLVDAGLILGPSLATEEAAAWLVENADEVDVSIRMARELLSPSSALESNGVDIGRPERHRRIAEYRRRLRRMPRDPLLWVDLAREYAAIGQNPSAERALRVALDLAPEDRFVLRSASRFFLHTHAPDAAHEVLLRASRTRRDPWLMAAEIVAASANGRQSRLIGAGMKLLQSSAVRPRHLSELASAIGTLEHEAGRRREVRRLFSQALRDPTENAVAQALWVGRHMSGLELPETVARVPRAFEAGAWVAAKARNFTEAVQLSWKWLSDEPFATRSALFGSYVAALAIGDFHDAIKLVKTAQNANPDDPRLLAQLLYCEASVGNVDRAEEHLSSLEHALKTADTDRTEAEWEVILAADRGLIAFRRGDVTAGRQLYNVALELALERNLREYAGSALINLTREEVLVSRDGQVDVSAAKAAVTAFPSVTQEIVGRFVERIELLAKAKQTEVGRP